MKSNSLAYRKQIPSPFFCIDENIFPLLETFWKILDRADCYSYYNFPIMCDLCPDNHLCLLFYINELEFTVKKRDSELADQYAAIKALKDEVQWFYSGG